jgi:16S rRNA G1207 methylase RsmC
LEPSAGLGRIWQALENKRPHNRTTLVEVNADCAAELYRMTEGKNAHLLQQDFLTMNPEEWSFDAVAMNPPFHMRSDIAHIKHALKFLNSGGVLVAIAMAGRKREQELKHLAEYWEELPAGSFKSEGTRVDTVIMRIRKA